MTTNKPETEERMRALELVGGDAARSQQQQDVAQLVEALDLALEYWRDRQQRYKNRRPKWVVSAESALAAHRKGVQP